MKTNELQPGTIVVMNATMRNEPPKVRRTVKSVTRLTNEAFRVVFTDAMTLLVDANKNFDVCE
jgi:hypothetical protein